MLAATADCPVPFPQAGSRAFLKDSADPVTIIRRNQDGTALIRRDPRPLERRNRDASGNTTVPLADLFETRDAAARAGLPSSLTTNERHLLNEIESKPGKAVRATLLQACTHLSQSGFHRVLNKMIRRGLIEWRGALVAVTPNGHAALADMR